MLTRVNEVVKLWCIGAVGKCVEHDRVANGKEGNQEAVEHGVEPNQLHCTKTKEEEEEEEERERERGGEEFEHVSLEKNKQKHHPIMTHTHTLPLSYTGERRTRTSKETCVHWGSKPR